MNLFFYIFLFIFWTLFGSFASVLIYRIKSSEGWMWTGRSHCKTCERNLSATELIPIFSWLFQWGKCRWCKQKISGIYPILEISTGLLFTWVWFFLIDPNLIFAGSILEWWRMIFFCTLMFLTIIYVFYDILYLEIPESILIAANILAVGGLILHSFGYNIIPYLTVWNWDALTIVLCILILSALYYIMLAGLKELYDCIIILLCIGILVFYMQYYDISYNYSALLSGTIAAIWIFLSFFLQILISGWKWMGWGDLRIAILMGLLVWVGLAFPAWMLCYIAGSIIGIGMILFSKAKKWWKEGMEMQIPFGPFIATWYILVLFLQPQISNFIEWYL